MKEINIALLGFGTVGQEVYQLLENNREILKKRLGVDFKVKKILVRDPNKKRKYTISKELFTTSFEEILNDPSIPIICELIGGIEPARTYILSALEKKKQVITANKAVLAERGAEIFNAAEKNRVFLGFEASVGGGIPIIKTLREALVGNKIERILGIINGTTNYILTRMLEQRISFEKALEEAKLKGYAEADPSLDLKGVDSAHKIAILGSLAFGVYIPFEKIYVEGIEKISLMDLEFAKNFGYIVKLLAEARYSKRLLEIRVFPALIPENQILTSIRLNYNGILIKGDFVGEILLYGLGAGGAPTASAVVSDIVTATEYLLSKKKPLISYPKEMEHSIQIKPIEQSVFKYYFRFTAVDQPGVLSKISGILGKYNISIASVIQIGRQKKKGAVPVVMLTHETIEKNVNEALKEIDNLEIVKAKTQRIRILD
ncbi:MAG: homoserine dehydrogenase [Caldimicrobium sp.]